jgi:hypothetical protein
MVNLPDSPAAKLHHRYKPSSEVEYVPKPENYTPEALFSPDFPVVSRRGKRRCQAWNKREGRQCLRIVSRGKRVCSVHGGSSKSGMASSQWKNGKFSRYLPKRLREKFDFIATDSKLLEQTEAIHIIDTRIADVLSRVDSGEAGAMWAKAREIYTDIQAAIQAEDSFRLNRSLIDLGPVLDRGAADYVAWGEIQELFRLRKQLIESERKRMLEMQLYLSVEQVANFYQALTLAVSQNVSDRDTLSRIQKSFELLTNVQPD